jgi:hypothetical protein
MEGNFSNVEEIEEIETEKVLEKKMNEFKNNVKDWVF